MANATNEAHEVAAIYGWHELFPGTIYREEIWMEVEIAREIIKRAKADDMYEAPMPDDDATCIVEAQGLVEMAEQAWAQHVRGPDVEAILRLVAGEHDGVTAEVESEPESEPEPESVPQGDVVLDALRDVPDNLKKSEPWEGYNDSRVVDITEGLNWYRENDPEEYVDLLKNVYAYEEARKNRQRILEFVLESWSRSQGIADDVIESVVETPEEPEEEPDEEEPEEEEDDGEPEEDEQASEAEASEPAEEPPIEEAQSQAEDLLPGHGDPYKKLLENIERDLKNERIDGIPDPPSDGVPELPWRWADITDIDLQNLHGQYASMAYYKGYVRSREERIALHCKEAADEMHSVLLVKAPKYDDKGKEVRITVMEAEIASDPNVARWRKLQRKHESMAAQARQEQESYLKVVEALSRHHTMRKDVWEMSGK